MNYTDSVQLYQSGGRYNFSYNTVFEELKCQTTERIPPGQSLARKFPVLHYGPVPKTELAGWDFRLWGEVKTQRSLSWEEFSALPRTRLVMDIHCVTRWSLLDTEWEGVSIQTLMR